MMMCTHRVAYFLIAASLLLSRTVFASGYGDVAVVVNTNSQVSLAIGSYFRAAYHREISSV